MKRFYKVSLSIMAIALAVAAQAASAPFIVEWTQVSQDQANAMSLLAKTSNEVYFAKDDVNGITNEISAIKTQFSEVASLNQYGAVASGFSVALAMLDNSVASQNIVDQVHVLAHLPTPVIKFMYGDVDITNLVGQIPDLARANQINQIVKLRAHYSVAPNMPFHITNLMVEFKYVMNVPALVNVLKPFRQLKYLESEYYVGDGDRIQRRMVSTDLVQYMFSKGDGDCPSGCTDWTSYRFDYYPQTGVVVKTAEDKSAPWEF